MWNRKNARNVRFRSLELQPVNLIVPPDGEYTGVIVAHRPGDGRSCSEQIDVVFHDAPLPARKVTFGMALVRGCWRPMNGHSWLTDVKGVRLTLP